jgi:hypothetical protein
MGSKPVSHAEPTASVLQMMGRGSSPARRVARLVIFLCMVLAMRGQKIGAQSSDEEYRVKAAFLFHFAQLVDWPLDSLKDTDGSLFLCTVGDDTFQGALEATIAGKAVGTRTLRVRHLKEAEDMQGCQIVFLGKAQSKHIPALLAGLHNAPILTVGETPGFLESGGMVRFLLEDNRVRFDINLAAADAAGLKIGARLLILAQNVLGQGRER